MRKIHAMKKSSLLVLLLLALLVLPTTALAASSSKAAKNAKAHAAYSKKIVALYKKGQVFDSGSYLLVDLTGDGVDEMVLSWWPSIYTYRGGKVVRVHDGLVGSSTYGKYYRAKKVITHRVPDRMGSSWCEYLKWNGKKFVKVAETYVPKATARQQGYKASYWVKGKGKVTKAQCQKYLKKLLGSSKAKWVKYNRSVAEVL